MDFISFYGIGFISSFKLNYRLIREIADQPNKRNKKR